MDQHRPIAIVVPNERSRDHMEKLFQRQIRAHEVLISVIGPDSIRTGYRQLQELGVSAILARGGTYHDFSALNGDIPLVQVKITMLDILEVLKTAEDAGTYRKIHLFLHESVAFDATMCKRFLHVPVAYHPYVNPSDLDQTLAALNVQPGALLVGSGFVPAYQKKMDAPFWDIHLKPETLMDYYTQARAVVEQRGREAENLSQLRAIVSQMEEGIVVIDQAGRICNANRRGEELLSKQSGTLVGLDIHELVVPFPFDGLLGRECCVPKRKLISVQDSTLSISIVSYPVRHGSFNYLLTLQPVKDIQKLEHDIRYKLAQKGLTASYSFQDILTRDPKMEKVMEQARAIADAEGSVLIYGESGTGKELFAQSIHRHSVRGDGPFVAVNCAALNESLLESELFGYVGGAFTGARKEGKAGLFELAHMGTLFLDEINSMPLNLQAKLLRVLEEHKVMRLGSDYVIPLDIRIIAAANQNLMESIRGGQFRSDLYYRLCTFTLNIPALNQRKGDIVLLFRSFLAQQTGESPDQIVLDADFCRKLEEHRWQGNVRELRNAALRYAVYHGENSDGEIFAQDGPARIAPLVSPEGRIDLSALNHTVEGLVIHSLLEQGMSKNDVARMLGISRQALYQKCKRMESFNGGALFE